MSSLNRLMTWPWVWHDKPKYPERSQQVKRLALGLLFGAAGYILAAVASFFLLFQLSSDDRDIEAKMASAFIFGPIAGIIAFVVGVVRGGSSSKTSAVGE
jgi:hypothetical protein